MIWISPALSLNWEHLQISAPSRKIFLLMNSSGLGMLIGGYTTMKNNGGEMKVAAVTDSVHKLLVITKLHTVFSPYATVDEAVASFAS